MRPHYIWTSFNYAQCRLGEVDDRVLRLPTAREFLPHGSEWVFGCLWWGGGGEDDPILAVFASYE